ncbi:hypothetical protein K431DRAFT_106323 [Polychaeton citri CBS 116435]|uniref:Uncharacterized protein n=1 Tax=Polychaeton citri CBS 116435 TaxID=1314669 RepID=A0A9P4UNT9_9PEZI|nr:hypothetical protein K431DRAFT_106323 [Polychaeton citri CBS 116435]
MPTRQSPPSRIYHADMPLVRDIAYVRAGLPSDCPRLIAGSMDSSAYACSTYRWKLCRGRAMRGTGDAHQSERANPADLGLGLERLLVGLDLTLCWHAARRTDTTPVLGNPLAHLPAVQLLPVHFLSCVRVCVCVPESARLPGEKRWRSGALGIGGCYTRALSRSGKCVWGFRALCPLPLRMAFNPL